MITPFSKRVAHDVASLLRDRWQGEFTSVEASADRARGLLHHLFHVEVVGVEPWDVRLTGWERDLSDLISGTVVTGPGLGDVLDLIDGACRSTVRDDVLPVRPRPHRDPSAGGWDERRVAALWARRRREAGEKVATAMTADETASLLTEVWPQATVLRSRDDLGRETLEVCPYGGNRVTVGMSRRGVLVVPVADGEGVPFPDGRSGITDGLRGQVLSALEAADEWLRRTAPTDEVLARPVIL